ARWPMRGAVRAAAVAIDTLLLVAGATLWALLRLDPLARDHWLAAKLGLLVVYVALGTLALRRARRPAQRLAFLAAALLVFGTMVSVALARHPLGLWRWG
ncbi:MAG TPA: SirB2 family protein, partial [Burkholderiaceae bacterium]|nr:SirB2 family protein [Burkholderiaceae bacterium]